MFPYHGVAKNNNKSQQVGSGAVLPRQGEGWGRGGEARRGTHRRGTQGEKEEEAGCESFERKDASLICQRQMISKTDQRGIKDVGI